ncbi:hypothetical protein ABAC402_09305 [Asticcacaulis sp. AC402]|nr:hypothetical protein ABAC402_09305 [Asticcacaulis sp. AC402]
MLEAFSTGPYAMLLPTRRTVLSAGLLTATAAAGAVRATPVFAFRAGVKSVLTARQSAICHIADYGNTQVVLLIVNGATVEVHARRAGLYHPKDPAVSRSVRALAPVDLNRLISAAGGLDQPVNGSVRNDAFHALYQSLKPMPVARACGSNCRAMGSGQALPIKDAFFRDWSFAHAPSGPFLAFSSPTVKAVWSLES